MPIRAASLKAKRSSGTGTGRTTKHGASPWLEDPLRHRPVGQNLAARDVEGAVGRAG